MYLKNKIIEAKLQIGLVNGAVRYVTSEGRIRTTPEEWEGFEYKLFVKDGVVYVEDKEGKRIEPIAKPESGRKKGSKNISDVQSTSDETSN